jgi:hypothetical protein
VPQSEAARPTVLSKLRKQWNDLKRQRAGERFQYVHDQQKDKSVAVKVAYASAAVLMFGAGVVFAFIPGPAVLFFALSAALVATQSAFVARLLDKGEVWGRAQLSRLRAWWRSRRGTHKPRRRKPGRAAS